MLVQISSGKGPVECEAAVFKLLGYFLKSDNTIEIISEHKGIKKKRLASVVFSTRHSYKEFDGTVQWICKGSYRRHHPRKNWFIIVSILPDIEKVIPTSKIKIDTFHSGGKGG